MKFFGNVSKLEAEITSAEQALQPDLESASIKTAMRDGKVIPIGDATVSEKYLALRSAHPPGTDLQERSNLLSSNDAISKALEKSATELAIAQTSVATLTREKVDLQGQISVSQASVQSLTGEKADLNNRLQAAVNQFSANDKELKARDLDLSKLCVAAGCLDLKSEAGDPLAADATEADKLAAATLIPNSDKLKAYRGAVNAAIAKTGALPLEIPVAPPGAATKQEPKGRARMLAAMKIDGFNS